MSDYYVMFEGTQYDVADFAAGVAKAQELGPSAVFYVEAPITVSSHATGVTTVLSGGATGYPYAGGNGVAVATANLTITAGTYKYVFNGGRNAAVGTSTTTIENGTLQYLFAGGWMNSSAANAGDLAILNVNGGLITTVVTASPYSGVLGEAIINISGGTIANYSGARETGRVNKVTLNVTGGTVAIGAGAGWKTKGSVGESNINISGGLITKLIGGNGNSESLENPGTLGKSNITISGGTVANAVWLGNSGANSGTTGDIDFTITGGTITGQLIGGSNNSAAALGNVTINLKGGKIGNNISGTSDSAIGVQGKTVINIDGFYGVTSATAGTWLYAANRGAAEEITINLKEGSVHLLCLGAAQNDINLECPITLNLSGGSTNWLIASYANASVTGDLTVNMTGGYVNSNFWLGNNKTVADFVESVGTNTINLSGGSVACAIHGAGRNIHQGDIHVNISGAFYQMNHIYAGGNNAGGVVQGNTYVAVSGGLLTRRIYGGGKQAGIVGNTNITVTGGAWDGTTGYWIIGGCESGATGTGKATINIEGADVYHVFGGGEQLGAEVLGGVEINVTGSTVHGVLQGGGYRGDVEGGITINVTNSLTTTEMVAVSNYGTCGWVVGASSATGNSKGDIEVAITGSTVQGSVIGGNDWKTTHDGDVSLTITGSTIGMTTDNGNGDIYLVGYLGTEIVGEAFTATLDNVYMYGAFYQGYGGNTFEGDTAVTISNSTIGNGIYLEYGDFTADSDTGELVSSNDTYIDGNVAFSLTDVTVTGDVWGKGRYFDLAAFAEGKGATLSVAGTLTASGEVAYFDTITLAAGATIAAGTTTASAITATASATQGLYTLATGFAAQACVVSVVDANGGALGSVTLSDSVTSGTFSAGGLDYTVSVADNALKLQVGDAPVPPTPTATVAEVILTITDPNHDYYGATGGWKVQNDQTVAWQDLTTLSAGYSYLGLGVTAANKAMPDIYVYNADAKYIAAYVTDDTGAISSFESIFLGEGALMQVGIADFNADGVSDLLLRTADGFVGYYANGAFAEVQGLGTEWTVAALGDVDGNGRADVIIAHEAGYVGAYLIGNDGSISWADLGNLDSNTAIVGAGDVNGDGTDDVIVQVGANYYGAWICTAGAVTGFAGIGTFDATVQDIADYNADGKDDLLFRTASGVVGAALINGVDDTTWAEYGALGDEWSTKGVGIL